ncbi:MAG: KamA family radical SAM protein [Lentisphaeria bacterium]|nr:KamA family radical SAM protein [Lentisphaeria bacterium]
MPTQKLNDRSRLEAGCFSPGDSAERVSPADWNDWRWQLANRVTDPEALIPAGSDPFDFRATARVYPMRVTPYYASLVKEWRLTDPVCRQIIPSSEELAETSLPEDGLGEASDSPLPGVIHRYPDRVLVLVTGDCAVFCRHCFRKRLWRRGNTYPAPSLADTRAYITARPAVKEVILSGGDALLLDETSLLGWLEMLGALPQLSAVRVASRLPAVLPQRVTKSLCDAMAARAPVWMMTQFNHPVEVTAEAAQACANLVTSGIPVLNQTVLLKGVNDRADMLARLFQGLVAMRVKPHYLFHGDPVAGTGHFRTGIARGLSLMKALRGKLSSLAMPSFAIDLPDGGGKVVLTPDHARGDGFETMDGRVVHYR